MAVIQIRLQIAIHSNLIPCYCMYIFERNTNLLYGKWGQCKHDIANFL